MIKTKIKKAVALSWIIAISASSLVTSGLGTAYAATQIGTGSVTGTGAFNTSIMWNDTYTAASASGSVSGIKVLAKVLPTLTMEISTGTIDLGNLTAAVAASGSLNIEIGTNAKSGVTITARSGSGWLTKTDNNAVQINNLTTDGVAESYAFSSTPGTSDSSAPGFTATGLSATQVFNNVTENTIYTTNKPENKTGVDDLNFKVTAQSTAETPAGTYQDTITFTVTGNF